MSGKVPEVSGENSRTIIRIQGSETVFSFRVKLYSQSKNHLVSLKQVDIRARAPGYIDYFETESMSNSESFLFLRICTLNCYSV